MIRYPALPAFSLVPILVLAACGGDAEPPRQEAAPPAPAPEAVAYEFPERPLPQAPAGARVRIVQPEEGAVVEGPRVTVVLEAEGVPIVPAADTTPGTGHHHLFLNDDVSPEGAIIPTITGRVVHLGTGVSEYTFEDVPPGEHRLIAVVADWLHVPLMPWVVDTVRFTVR